MAFIRRMMELYFESSTLELMCFLMVLFFVQGNTELGRMLRSFGWWP